MSCTVLLCVTLIQAHPRWQPGCQSKAHPPLLWDKQKFRMDGTTDSPLVLCAVLYRRIYHCPSQTSTVVGWKRKKTRILRLTHLLQFAKHAWCGSMDSFLQNYWPFGCTLSVTFGYEDTKSFPNYSSIGWNPEKEPRSLCLLYRILLLADWSDHQCIVVGDWGVSNKARLEGCHRCLVDYSFIWWNQWYIVIGWNLHLWSRGGWAKHPKVLIWSFFDNRFLAVLLQKVEKSIF